MTMVPSVESTAELVSRVYERMYRSLSEVRARLERPLTLAEKILFGHLANPESQQLVPGASSLALYVDRVIMQDATAQMAILQFMQAGLGRVAVPTTIHCDHLIRARHGAAPDLQDALDNNREVYDFLRTAAAKFGMGFWEPGSGIIHQVALENYAFPGGLIIGSDSHTPNLGGLAMIAIGVGGADAVDAMTGMPWEVLMPKLVGVRLTGRLAGWTAPKDIILKVAELLTVKGGTNRIIEYFGPGARTLSATGKATITNMGAEIGATTSIFPYDRMSEAYLRATGREGLADLADQNLELLEADADVEADPQSYFDEVFEIDLSALEPLVAGPFTPDLVRAVSELAPDAKRHHYPGDIRFALIGSCTNSSYEDLSRAADVARQALKHGARAVIPLLINPGSQLIHDTVERDGQLEVFEKVGATILANACGPCIGQWARDDIVKGETNTIMNSYNRNFPARNDSNPETMAFVASPEIVMAYALSGSLGINPLSEELDAPDGSRYRLVPPAHADALPAHGYLGRHRGFVPPAANPDAVTVRIIEGSERLALLEPFAPIVEPELSDMPVLFKARGKTTTDAISPAGPWLKFRGHLARISDNLLLQAVNAFTGARGTTVNVLTGERGLPVAKVARYYQTHGKRWVIVGDENYGEGSSREHAAMSPRFLGCAAVIARSFARIHESNLKKQGILPLTFDEPADYEKIRETDTVSLEYLHELDTVRTINALFKHGDGTADVITLRHNLTMEQLAWFQAGSALNYLRLQGSRAA